MIIARLHQGSLADAMETAKTFDSIEEMKQWFVDACENAFSVDDVVIGDEEMFDFRINWNTRYVCTKRYRNEDFVKEYGTPQCIGMCDLDYKGELQQ